MARTSTVVVGGGCSGVLASVQLLRQGDDRVTMVEPAAVPGRGVAYSTPAAAHLLNSRAAAMSGDPDRPDDFVNWAHRQGRPVGPAGFAVRGDYGRYLHDLLEAATAGNPGRFTHVRARALQVYGGDGKVVVATDRAGDVRADRAVLAIGHSTPERPRPLTDAAVCHPGYVADPWRPGVLDAVRTDAPVLLVGTGLTAIDVAMLLQARGIQAPIHAVSRHGLLPLVQTADPAPVPVAILSEVDGLRPLIRQLRRAAATAADWRDLVDGLRPQVNTVWARLTPQDRERFLRHASRYWEIHRHRMAPSVAVVVRGMVADGVLRVAAANLTSVSPDGSGFVATAASGIQWRVGTVINCTGRATAARSSLGRALLASGQARLDPLGVGLDADPAGHLVCGTGQPQERIVVIGPPRRGRLWETDAVPEIRAQARALLDLPSWASAPVGVAVRRSAPRPAA